MESFEDCTKEALQEFIESSDKMMLYQLLLYGWSLILNI